MATTNAVTAITPKEVFDQYVGRIKFLLIELEAEMLTTGKRGL